MVDSPIFIVGAPRSGTSLLRNILNRHAAIGLCDETYFFYYVYSRRRAFGDLRASAARQHLIAQYCATTRIRDLHLDGEALKVVLQRDGTSYPDFYTALLRAYATAHGKTRWGEKTPQHALFAELLCAWYPRCHLIHLLRDPRDVVASLQRMPWASRNVLANARRWQRAVQAAESCRGRDNYLEVRYEALVNEPEGVVRGICEFIGVDYSDELLHPGTRDAELPWWFARAQDTIDAARAGGWRQQLSDGEVAVLEARLAADMHRCGYRPLAAPATWRQRRAAAVGEVAARAAQTIRALPRMWHTWLRPTELSAEEARIDAPARGHRPEAMSRG